ncbi:MAG: threonine synthase [Actinomycetota bacterium]
MTSVRYVSTRGRADELGFADVLLAGLARDGGLYVPDRWPDLPDLSGLTTYEQVAAAIVSTFVGDDPSGVLTTADVERLCADAYGAFRHPAVAPLVQIDDRHFVLELFHGPTLAFKDIALQLVGRMFDHVLSARSERITIVGATSGDTGSAAIDGVRGCDNVDIVILYPAGRTSEVQRRQMTTVDAPNVHAVAVEGTFDDCQDLVKAMFADETFRDELGLSAVNSINWARVMAQVVYYVTASRTFADDVSFCVPTGNFGNVLAGWIARRMGAPVHDFVVASNANDILTRFIEDDDMTTRDVVPTASPSMDIQVSSNFERLLFEMNDRNGLRTAEQLVTFRTTGRLEVSAAQRRDHLSGSFRAVASDDHATFEEIGKVYADTGMLIDPHTATGTAAVRRLGDGSRSTVTLATAHPAKFPDAVERATGVRPALPPFLADLFERPERTRTLPADLLAVQAFVRSVSRVTG